MNQDGIKYYLVIYALIFTSILFLATVTPNYPGFSDNSGWWLWYDQGEYLRQLNYIADHGLSKIQGQFVYPPGYFIIPAYIMKIFEIIGLSIPSGYFLIIYNAVLCSAGMTFLLMTCSVQRRFYLLVFLLSSLFLIPMVRSAFVIPWSSSVSFLVISYSIYYIQKSKFLIDSNADPKIKPTKFMHAENVLFGIMLCMLMHTRPQDTLILAASCLCFLFWKQNKMARWFYFHQISNIICIIILVEGLLFISAGGFAFGDLYVESPHSFFLDGVYTKLYSLLVGAAAYGTNSISVVQESKLLALLIVISILAIFRYGGVFSISLFVMWCLVYGAFSDFGPHNFMRFLLFHYYKTIFFVGLFLFVWRANINHALLIIFIAPFLLLGRVDPGFENLNCNIEKKGDVVEGFCEKVAFQRGDVIYLAPLDARDNEWLSQPFFNPPKLEIAGTTLVPFKHYRVFQGHQGIYIHIYKKLGNVNEFKINIEQYINELDGLKLYKVN